MKRNELAEAKNKIEMLTNHLLDSIDVDLLSDSQKIAYQKAIQPYVMPKLQDIKSSTDLNLSDEFNDQFLGGLNSASKKSLKEPIIFYPLFSYYL